MKMKKFAAYLLALVMLAAALPMQFAAAEEASPETNAELSRRAARESAVLMKNDNNALPIKQGGTVALFGAGQIKYIKGGGGSGDVNVKHTVNILEGMKNKEKEKKVTLNTDISSLYEKNPNVQITQEQVKAAAKTSDTAIMVISRGSYEGGDRVNGKGDYLLSDGETNLISMICNAGFKKVVVLLNVVGVIDMNWVNDNKIDAVLNIWCAGMEGGDAAADLLCGDVNPSGKLTDTWAKSYEDYPSSKTFNESEDYINHEEDIYVGYRYFETFDSSYSKVAYPFGFGLSYTSFNISDVQVKEEGGNISVTAKVTNTGSVPGREVVQTYFSSPQMGTDAKLSKASKELAAWKKTKLLKQNESETVIMSFPISDMASYDDTGVTGHKSAYVLEKGDYNVYVGNSVKNAGESGIKYTHTEGELRVTEQLTQQSAPTSEMKRLLADGTYETLTPQGESVDNTPSTETASKETESGESSKSGESSAKKVTLKDVYYNNATMEQLVNELSDDELVHLSGGHAGKATGSIGGLYDYDIPDTQTADGPAGIRADYATAWPSETALASSWDPELLEKIGKATADEAISQGIDIWLAPGINIHRNPLCGRNFEYYSEDPLISGKMAVALSKGVQSKKVAVTVKHLAANNRERNRKEVDSRISERALREIYLKGFEIAVKEGDPWCIMSSYNKLNGTGTSESRSLLTNILRNEWGFKGMVMSDWGNTRDKVKEINAGQCTNMYGGSSGDVKKAIENGTITREQIRKNVGETLNMIMKTTAMNREILNPKPIEYKTISGTDITYIHGGEYSKSYGGFTSLKSDSDAYSESALIQFGTNKWVEYGVNVEKAGKYRLYSRTAGWGSNFTFKLDDKEIGRTPVEMWTADWDKWTTLAPVDVQLTEGKHILRVECPFGSCNVNWFRFVPISETAN